MANGHGTITLQVQTVGGYYQQRKLTQGPAPDPKINHKIAFRFVRISQ